MRAQSDMNSMTKDKPSQELNRVVFEGDNLDVLRGINSDSVDLVYLDPPFNSNKVYEAPVGSRAAGAAFKDAWTLSDVDLIEHNRLKREHEWLYALIHAAKRTHSNGMFSYLMMMSPRLFELRRVLKPTGSIYLHCDPTASHYLKLVMDGVFGSGNFRNEIAWERTTGRKAGKQYGRTHDVILFYAKSQNNVWNAPTVPQSEKSVRGHDLMRDQGGLYRMSDFSGAGPGPARRFGDREIEPPAGRHWMYDQQGVDRLMREGRVAFSRTGRPRLKTYLKGLPGVAVRDIWADIDPINAAAQERIGFPTQKPLALLDRIIKASSNEGDMVLDPFCGCATTLVSAEFLNRQWCGIDLSPKAAELVVQRIREKQDMFSFTDFRHAVDVPIRTDVERQKASTPKQRRELKNRLYNDQEGRCNLCRHEMGGIQHFEMDHVVPKAKGGQDWVDNFQLLCANCNRIKGQGSQEAARAKIAKYMGMNFAVFE